MTIERHLNTPGKAADRLHDMTIETPERAACWFDLKREITENDRQSMLRELEELREIHAWPAFLDFAATLKLLGIVSPDDETEEDKRSIEGSIYEWSRAAMSEDADAAREGIGMVRGAVCDAKILFPSDTYPDFESAKEDVEFSIKKGFDAVTNTPMNTKAVIAYLMANPSFRVDTAAIDKALVHLSESRQRILHGYLANSTAGLGAKIKLLVLKRMPSFTDHEIAFFRNNLDRMRERRDWISFADDTLDLAIIAADHVKVTKNGMILTSSTERITVERKSRPERKAV